MKSIYSILLLTIITSNAFSQDIKDKEVYLSVFNDSIIGKKFILGKIVVIDSTSNWNYKHLPYERNDFFKAQFDTEAVIKMKNEFYKSDTIKIGLKYLDLDTSIFYLISNQHIKEFFIKNNNEFDWKKFSKRFPNSYGFNKLSIIKYSVNNDYAICFLENFCGELCGEGILLVFIKINNKWSIYYAQSIWES